MISHHFKNILPFSRSYWVIPGKLLAGQIPVDTNPDISTQKIKNLLKLNIRCIINLQEENETNSEGILFRDYNHIISKIKPDYKYNFYRFPIKDMGIPQKKLMIKILNTIDFEINNGNTVYVHCWGGIGRTGTVIGCYLIRHKMANKNNVIDMIKYLRRTDPENHRQSPETPEQINFILNWED
ncbi:MAG: protein-tyrosine phosphatase family protein [Marinilabiliales bacterium]